MSKEIIKCVQYDLLKTKAKIGQMYFVTDARLLYKDYGNNLEERRIVHAIILNTESERLNSIKPSLGKFYYVDETNSLWFYDGRWILKIGDSKLYNTYSCYNGYLSPVINNDETITGVNGDKIIDNNGLLGDGSITIRDVNRMLKSNFKADNINNSILMKSYMDNGFTFIPNAHLPYSDLTSSLGALHLTVEKHENLANSLDLEGNAYYYGSWNNFGNMYVINKDDSSEIYPDYIPINNYEIVKYYIECTKTAEDNSNKIKKTYMVIRPISTTSAIINIISMYNEFSNSVVKNDLGELIFANNPDLIENVTLNCTRNVYIDDDGYKTSEYILDNYNATLVLKQKENENVTATIPDIWSDNPNFIINLNKWTKQEVLTDKLLPLLSNLSDEVERLNNKINELEERINQLNSNY